MIEHREISRITCRYNELVPLGADICRLVEESQVTNGVVYVITMHTTTGITVNERLECLEDDILSYFEREFPEDGFYYHARFLDSYGAMAGNPTGPPVLSGLHPPKGKPEGQIHPASRAAVPSRPYRRPARRCRAHPARSGPDGPTNRGPGFPTAP